MSTSPLLRSASARASSIRSVLVVGVLVMALALVGCAAQDDPAAEGPTVADDSTDGPDDPTEEEPEPTGGIDPAPEGGVTLADLDGRSFVTTDDTAEDTSYDLVPGTQVMLQVEGDRLSVNAGCNTIGGTVVLDLDATPGTTTVEVAQTATTEMGCDEARHEQDRWLAELLEASPTLTLDGDRLTLTASGDRTLALIDRTVAEPAVDLVGTTWILTGFVDGDVAESASVARPAGLQLLEDGAFTGSDGIGEIAGTYVVSGSGMDFADVDLGDRAGAEDDPELADYADRVQALLTSGVEWEITGDVLTLTAPDGSGATWQAVPTIE